MSFDAVHPLWLIAVSVTIAALPLLLGLTTAYVKVNVVLQLLRSGLGAQQVPSASIIMALSVAMTLTIMGPVFEESFAALEEITLTEDEVVRPDPETLGRLAPVLLPWRAFLEQHAGAREVHLLRSLMTSPAEQGQAPKESSVVEQQQQERVVPWNLLLPAFVLSELKEAFAMGVMLLLPFLVVDLVVANILVGMGMFMVSPVMISLPLKLLLFVVSDGWLLLMKALIHSYVAS